jgi:hypothetical protein
MEKLTLAYSIGFFLFMLGLSILAYSLRKAECVEDEAQDIPGRDDIDYRDIDNYCERPFIPYEHYN